MKADVDQVDFNDGVYSVQESNLSRTFQETAFAAYVPHDYPDDLEPGLAEKAFYDPNNFTFPAGAYICEVEIDPDTGDVDIDRLTAVDDFGNVINPMIVEGQVHGGIAQGLGQALLENTVYSDDGQLLTGSFMDYCMPRADDLPFVSGRHDGNALHAQSGGCQRAAAKPAPSARHRR